MIGHPKTPLVLSEDERVQLSQSLDHARCPKPSLPAPESCSGRWKAPATLRSQTGYSGPTQRLRSGGDISSSGIYRDFTVNCARPGRAPSKRNRLLPFSRIARAISSSPADPFLHREGARYRGALSQPARPRSGALRRREEPESGFRQNSTGPANGTRLCGGRHPCLCPSPFSPNANSATGITNVLAKHPKMCRWRAQRPRYQIHYTPTSSSGPLRPIPFRENRQTLVAYCPRLGGLKPSPSGDGFQRVRAG
jgi:hypothetical protein